MSQEINWGNPDLCYHVIDYAEMLGYSREILERVTDILVKGLLTPEEMGRGKRFLGLTPTNRIDVFSTKMGGNMGEDPKQYLSNIVFDVGTTVNLLLEAKHEEVGSYPHSLVIEGEKPKIVALVVDEESPLLYEDDLINEFKVLTIRYGILLLDRNLNNLKVS